MSEKPDFRFQKGFAAGLIIMWLWWGFSTGAISTLTEILIRGITATVENSKD
jgi:hypothetical protein